MEFYNFLSKEHWTLGMMESGLDEGDTDSSKK